MRECCSISNQFTYSSLEDEWVPLKDAQTTKTVKLSSLPLTNKLELQILNRHCQQPQNSSPESEQHEQEQQQRNRRKARVPEQRSDSLS